MRPTVSRTLTSSANQISFCLTILASFPEVPMTQYLTVDGGTLAYDVTGDSGPLVVLAPGLGDSRQAYRFVAPELAAAGYRVATIDLRGMAVLHPRSDRGRLAGPRAAPGRSGDAGRPLVRRRRGHHRGGQAPVSGHRADRGGAVHAQAAGRAGRSAGGRLPPRRAAARAGRHVRQRHRVEEVPRARLPR